MAVRLRLRRMGKKKQPFYRIVAIDSRASRDGKYLDNIGFYNPLPNPIDLNVKSDRALFWLQRGAQPSDTVKSLLRKKGVMLQFDLLKRGKSEEEIALELKKWEVLQEERMKRFEAAQVQAGKERKTEKKKSEEKETEQKVEKEVENTAEQAEVVEENKEQQTEARSDTKTEESEKSQESEED